MYYYYYYYYYYYWVSLWRSEPDRNHRVMDTAVAISQILQSVGGVTVTITRGRHCREAEFSIDTDRRGRPKTFPTEWCGMMWIHFHTRMAILKTTCCLGYGKPVWLRRIGTLCKFHAASRSRGNESFSISPSMYINDIHGVLNGVSSVLMKADDTDCLRI